MPIDELLKKIDELIARDDKAVFSHLLKELALIVKGMQK